MKDAAEGEACEARKRKAAGSIPIVGAAVGAAVNAWYLNDVAQAARFTFQERWLRERYPQLHVA